MDLNKLTDMKGVFMDLVKDGKYPENTNQFALGDGSGYNLIDNSIDFQVVNTVNKRKYNFVIEEITE